jgi:hypothetical protein
MKLTKSFSPLGALISKDPSALEMADFLDAFPTMLALSTGVPLASVILPLTVKFWAFKKWGRHIIANANNSLVSFDFVCFINSFRFLVRQNYFSNFNKLLITS